jgi:hypothetical protein
VPGSLFRRRSHLSQPHFAPRLSVCRGGELPRRGSGSGINALSAFMNFDTAIQFLEQKWHTKWGRLIALLVAASLVVVIVPETGLWWRLIGMATTATAVTVGWLLGCSPRRHEAASTVKDCGSRRATMSRGRRG